MARRRKGQKSLPSSLSVATIMLVNIVLLSFLFPFFSICFPMDGALLFSFLMFCKVYRALQIIGKTGRIWTERRKKDVFDWLEQSRVL